AERVKKEGFEKDIYIMDTVFAACAGVTSDERFDFDSYNLILNFGNSHTLGIVVKGYNVHALFEHHTRILEKNPHFLKKIIDDFLEWNLSSKEVMDNDGHGSFYLTDSKLTIKNIFVTGPRRNIACNFEREYINASPWGDMMITGNVGLINSFNSIFS
ncbi:MAG: DUF1786 family protein, partial [Candidatus Muiribacteriota bacterium]